MRKYRYVLLVLYQANRHAIADGRQNIWGFL